MSLTIDLINKELSNICVTLELVLARLVSWTSPLDRGRSE
jgi:hypothetical protein